MKILRSNLEHGYRLRPNWIPPGDGSLEKDLRSCGSLRETWRVTPQRLENHGLQYRSDQGDIDPRRTRAGESHAWRVALSRPEENRELSCWYLERIASLRSPRRDAAFFSHRAAELPSACSEYTTSLTLPRKSIPCGWSEYPTNRSPAQRGALANPT